MKVPVQPQDMRMTQIHLDLDLSAQLLLDLVLDELVLVHALERNNVPLIRPATRADHVYTSEFALAEGAAHFEVVERPHACWRVRLARVGGGEDERVELHRAAAPACFVAFQAAVIPAQVHRSRCCCRAVGCAARAAAGPTSDTGRPTRLRLLHPRS